MNHVTKMLLAIEYGDAAATEHLLPLVYQELRRTSSSTSSLSLSTGWTFSRYSRRSMASDGSCFLDRLLRAPVAEKRPAL